VFFLPFSQHWTSVLVYDHCKSVMCGLCDVRTVVTQRCHLADTILHCLMTRARVWTTYWESLLAMWPRLARSQIVPSWLQVPCSNYCTSTMYFRERGITAVADMLVQAESFAVVWYISARVLPTTFCCCWRLYAHWSVTSRTSLKRNSRSWRFWSVCFKHDCLLAMISIVHHLYLIFHVSLLENSVT